MSELKSMRNAVAIVTGGSKGYGKGIAAKLKERGAEVWITGRNSETLEVVASELDCNWFQADVASAGEWDDLMNAVKEKHGRLDLLVNNAGFGGEIADSDQQSVESIEATIAVNLTGSILGCRLASALMKEQKSGTIINISSVCARQAWPGWGVYSAAKAGLVQYSKSLYLELRPFGVRVTSLIPSWGATEFNVNAGIPKFDAETAAKCISAEDIGNQVISICELPKHLCIQDITLLPLVQEINPL